MIQDYAQPVYTLLNADGTFKAFVTGGVYFEGDLPAEGFSRAAYPLAYDANRLLNPICIVKGRSVERFGGLVDAGYSSTRQVVELWLYADRTKGRDEIIAAATRSFQLLHYQKVPGAFRIEYLTSVFADRDPTMGNAKLVRVDYEVIGKIEA